MGVVLHLELTCRWGSLLNKPRTRRLSGKLSFGIAETVTDYMDQVPQNVDGQGVLNNVLAGQPALLADNQPVDHNRGNQPAVDAVVSARLVFIHFVPIFYRLQAIHQGCKSTTVIILSKVLSADDHNDFK